ITFGISGLGILFFFLPMVPNFIYMAKAPLDELDKKDKKMKIDGEELSRDFLAFFLVVIKTQEEKNALLLIIALLFLSLYYVVWGRYFKFGMKKEDLLSPFWGIPVPLALLPIPYFVFVSLYLANLPAMVLSILFGFFHIRGALKDKKKGDEEK
ncbi:MAG: hypothetical protein ACI4S4_06915, partial [Candidatus Ornithospirochaeta sp.]